MKTDKKCTVCGKFIVQIRDIPMVNFTNVEQPDSPKFFCSKICKFAWLLKRKQKIWRIKK